MNKTIIATLAAVAAGAFACTSASANPLGGSVSVKSDKASAIELVGRRNHSDNGHHHHKKKKARIHIDIGDGGHGHGHNRGHGHGHKKKKHHDH